MRNDYGPTKRIKDVYQGDDFDAWAKEAGFHRGDVWDDDFYCKVMLPAFRDRECPETWKEFNLTERWETQECLDEAIASWVK